jgi:hypothetical protein
MLGLDTTMMRPLDPSFQVAENEMDHGQVRFGFVRVAAERQCLMVVSHLRKAGVASPAIGAQRGAKRDVFFDKAGKSFSAPVRNDAKPQTSRIDAASALLAVILTGPNLDGTDHDRLVMSAASLSARLTADQAFIDLDGMQAANRIALWANHPGAELVEYLKGRLVATESKLPLELDSGLSGDLRGHEVCTPKPHRERRMARLHYGACRKRRIGFAPTTSQHDRRPRSEPVRFSYKPALRTRKSVRPTNGFKVASTSRVIGEHPLKLWKGSREAANVHVGDNGRFLYLCQATG